MKPEKSHIPENPTIVVNIGHDDPTRGDAAGWKGLAGIIAEKTGGNIIYADKRSLSAEYAALANTRGYSGLLAHHIGKAPAPAFWVGHYDSTALDIIGLSESPPYVVNNINESLSRQKLNEHELVSHNLTKEILATEGKLFDEKHPDIKKPIFAVMLVDPGFGHDSFCESILDLAAHYPAATIYLCGSRRTPPDRQKELIANLDKALKHRKLGKRIQILSHTFAPDAPYNPYKGLIARAKHFIVWGNSQSMVSEALFSGRTVYSYGGGNYTNLRKDNLVVPFKEAAENSPPISKKFKPVNITEKLADVLIKEADDHFKDRKRNFYEQHYGKNKSHIEAAYRISLDPNEAENIPKALKSDPAFIRLALNTSGVALRHFPDYQADAEMAKIAYTQSAQAADYFSPSLRDNVEFMAEFASKHPNKAIETASEKLKDDFTFAFAALKATRGAQFEAFSERIRTDHTFIKKLITSHAVMLENIPQPLIDDRGTLLDIIRRYPEAIKRSKIWSNDATFAREAICINSDSYENFSDTIKDNDSLTDLAVGINAYHYHNAPTSQRRRKALAIKALSADSNCASSLPLSLKNDRDLAKIAISHRGRSISYFGSAIRNDPELALAAINNDYIAFSGIGKRLAKMPTFLSKVVAIKTYNFYRDIDYDLRQNKAIVRAFLSAHPDRMHDVEMSAYSHDLPFAIELVKTHGFRFYDTLPYRLQQNPEILKASISHNPKLLKRHIQACNYFEDMSTTLAAVATVKGINPDDVFEYVTTEDRARAVLTARPDWKTLKQSNKWLSISGLTNKNQSHTPKAHP